MSVKKDKSAVTSSTEYRMYTLVMYNLSGIQKGIQSAHSIAEYSKRGDLKLYDEWLDKWKTIIVLNGGTSTNIIARDPSTGVERSSSEENVLGTMETNLQFLKDHNISAIPFYEPDLNYSLSSFAFVLPDYVFKVNEEVTPWNTVFPKEHDWNDTIAVRDWLGDLRLA
jgi:hypothetical protein